MPKCPTCNRELVPDPGNDDKLICRHCIESYDKDVMEAYAYAQMQAVIDEAAAEYEAASATGTESKESPSPEAIAAATEPEAPVIPAEALQIPEYSQAEFPEPVGFVGEDGSMPESDPPDSEDSMYIIFFVTIAIMFVGFILFPGIHTYPISRAAGLAAVGFSVANAESAWKIGKGRKLAAIMLAASIAYAFLIYMNEPA